MRSAVLYGRCAGITCSRSRQPVSGDGCTAGSARWPMERGRLCRFPSPLPGPVATPQSPLPNHRACCHTTVPVAKSQGPLPHHSPRCHPTGPVATSQALAPGLQLDAIGIPRATGLETILVPWSEVGARTPRWFRVRPP
ncbi:unnamed protein product [Arctogadus glacialis]